MTNRIVGNVYIIDSQTGAANALQPGSASWLDNHFVTAFSFLGNDTTALIELVFATATDSTAVYLERKLNFRGSEWSNFGQSTYFRELRCKTLTNGTGYIYFS